MNDKNTLPPLPESDLYLAFYDEGGIQEASGQGYTEQNMRDYARQYSAWALVQYLQRIQELESEVENLNYELRESHNQE